MFEQAWLYPCRVISQAAQLRRQATNKHVQGVGNKNRKSSKMSSPHERHLASCVSEKIHKDFVQRRAYKQIIRALIDAKKYKYISVVNKLIKGENLAI